MSNFAYVAFDSKGRETKGVLDVLDQTEAIRRLKEMGFFPTKIGLQHENYAATKRKTGVLFGGKRFGFSFSTSVRPIALSVFTRQLATLIEAGMPLLRGLRLLEEQETNKRLKQIIREISSSIESGGQLSEAVSAHPKIFNRLYVNMIKAGEIGGVLDVVLKRLAEFMEKAKKIKGKIIAALFYPVAVIVVAIAILCILMVFVVPRFKQVFDGLLNGRAMPAFTTFVLNLSDAVKNHFLICAGLGAALIVLGRVLISTARGRRIFDRLKLNFPLLGPVVSKAAISRFTRTFGTLVSSGVPILQTLSIVKETTGNAVVSDAIGMVHESVKEGETITAPLKAAGVFPAMVVGMIDVGEQTGALPEMLLKIADNYDDEVDNAVASMTSLLEPIMIIFLAVIVGSIVVALFLPLIYIIDGFDTAQEPGG